jgi:hypothetical protein
MWPQQFEKRLIAWNSLRSTANDLPLQESLLAINKWWQQVPWRPYYLHWDDQTEWPDPWQLLSDNIYCDVAKGLGIMYTIMLLNRSDLTDAILAETDQGNLVLLESGKYILNWGEELKVNTNLEKIKINKIVSQDELKQKID